MSNPLVGNEKLIKEDYGTKLMQDSVEDGKKIAPFVAMRLDTKHSAKLIR